MDFINLWSFDVVDLVFQHASGKEILDFMCVSKDWNAHLERSRALKKIAIFLQSYNTNLKCLLNSKRKYRHLRVINGTTISREIVEIVANPLHEFNSITIFRTSFEKEKQIEQIFLNASASLESLCLHYTTYDNNNNSENDENTNRSDCNITHTSYDFPRLKTITLDYIPDTPTPWINKYIASFVNVETITLGNACDENIKKLIFNAPKLKRLTLSGKFHDKAFYKDLSNKRLCQLNLEEFVFNNILSSSHADENLSYFNTFFTSQSKTLKIFKTDALLEPDELESAFRMPNLTELSMKGFHYNMEIMQIHIENLRMRSTEIPVASLRSFDVHYMNQHLLELLALNARNLIELRVMQFDPTDVSNPKFFTKLEVLMIYFCDNDVRERILEKAEDERSHFEKMINTAISNVHYVDQEPF
jgi:hypothetical protein